MSAIADFFRGRNHFSTITLLLFHSYFALGLLVLGWAHLVVFGYFIEAGVQLCFSAAFIVLARESHWLRTLLKFSLKAFLGMILYFIFLFILDFAMKESYRADSLLIKLLLTLESFADPGFQSEDFFVNLFTREVRNEFVLESAIAFFLTVIHQVALFFSHRKTKKLNEPSLLALTQFWFLLAMQSFLVGYFKLNLTFGWFLIITRVSFDWITHRGESAAVRQKLARQFIYHLIVLVIGVALLSDMNGIFERIFASITVIVFLVCTSSIMIKIKPDEQADGVGERLPLWEKILLAVEIHLIAAVVFLPLMMPQNKKSIVELMPSKRELLCRLGSTERCVEIAAETLSAKKDWPLVQKAIADLERFCNQSNADACYTLGIFQFDEIGGAKTDVGIEHIQKACDLDHAFACYRLIAKKDKARALWHAACGQHDGQACFHLGRVYETVDKKIATAVEIYQKGCAAQNAASCNAVGFYLQKNDDTGREAARHYLIACRSGNFTGCANAGLLYKNGTGVPAKHSHAQSLLFLSCQQGKSGFGCYEYARFLREHGSYDQVTELSKWEAKEKFKEACSLGYEAACPKK